MARVLVACLPEEEDSSETNEKSQCQFPILSLCQIPGDVQEYWITWHLYMERNGTVNKTQVMLTIKIVRLGGPLVHVALAGRVGGQEVPLLLQDDLVQMQHGLAHGPHRIGSATKDIKICQ